MHTDTKTAVCSALVLTMTLHFHHVFPSCRTKLAGPSVKPLNGLLESLVICQWLAGVADYGFLLL